MKIIYAKNGEEIYVDDEDYLELNKHVWVVNKPGYAQRHGKTSEGLSGSTLLIHRVIMNAPKGMVVDHIEHDLLDNQKKNLRLCTQAENCRNQRSKKGKVSQKWRAVIMVEGKNINLGSYTNIKDAIQAREYAEVIQFEKYKEEQIKKLEQIKNLEQEGEIA